MISSFVIDKEIIVVSYDQLKYVEQLLIIPELKQCLHEIME